MKLSEINLQNATDEAFVLAKALTIIGVQDQDVEIFSTPSHEGGSYHPYTEIKLSVPHQRYLHYIEVPGVWGQNLVSIEGTTARLVECATKK